MEQLRGWLEIAYFFAGVVVAFVAAVGLQQLKIMKRDMMIRIERAAKEKAIEYATRYLSIYTQLSDKYTHEYGKKELSAFEGEIGSFTKSALTAPQIETAMKRISILSWMPAMNELEAIAAAFMTGVADEQTGFKIIGKTFCSTVALKYDILCFCRKGGPHDFYQNIVDLYLLWSPRLSKAELEEARQRMEEKISCIPDRSVAPIGKTA